MIAARLHAARDVRIDEVPTPAPGAGEVLVRVRACSICASDCRLYMDGHAGGVVPDHPMIQGHEFAGDIMALGEGVSGPPVGTRVAVEPSWHCGHCDMCLQGYQNLCRSIVFPSFPQRDGALAEYIACPEHAVCPLPEHVSYVEGAWVEPLGVAIHAVRLADAKPGHRILIVGAGAVGICTLLFAKSQGHAQIAVVEPVAGRATFAERSGAKIVAQSCEQLQASGYEPDVVFECAGEAQAVRDAIELVRPAGKLVIVGIPHPEEVTFSFALPRRKQLTMLFSRRSLNTLPEAVELVGSGRVDVKSLPVRHYGLSQAAEAIEATMARPGDMLRAVVCP